MAEASFLYQNAPLMEVVAEIRWELKPINSIPNAAIDPFFDVLSRDFHKSIVPFGFESERWLVPENFPLELIPGKVIFRYQKEPDGRLVFQLGPGVFTVNNSSPYAGWSVFQSNIKEGLKQLFKTYPSPQDFLNLWSIELRYLNIFDSSHGSESYHIFLKEHLGVDLEIKKELLGKYCVPNGSVDFSANITIPLSDPKGCIGEINTVPGKKGGENVTLLGLSVEKRGQNIAPDLEEILNWFGQAHTVLHDWFQILTSVSLKKKMNSPQMIGEGQ